MASLLSLLSAFCATVPILGFLALLWWFDRYDREPVGLVAAAYLWGAVGAVGIAVVVQSLLGVLLQTGVGLDDVVASQILAGIVAPLVEEPAKAAILFPIAFSRQFDNTTDGFVYGATVGLGFGMTENYMYFASAAGEGALVWMFTVVVRTFFSAVMHAVATSCVGALVGWARFRSLGAKLVAAPIGLGLAVGIHAVWNGLLVLDAGDANALLRLTNFAALPLEFLVVFVTFQLCLLDERRTIRNQLREEAGWGTLPADHVEIIASWFRRGRSGWLPDHVDRPTYIRLATTLAFRKNQAAASQGTTRAFYEGEITRVRDELRGVLARGATV